MKNFRTCLIALACAWAAFALPSCNSDGGTQSQGSVDPVASPTPTAAPGKPLFSLWTADDGSQLDFSGLEFGSSQYTLTLDDLTCTCTLTITGEQSSGTFSISGCTAEGGGLGTVACQAALHQSGTYTNSGTELEVCAQAVGGCKTYR